MDTKFTTLPKSCFPYPQLHPSESSDVWLRRHDGSALEIVIKMFTRAFGDQLCEHVEQYAHEFLRFIEMSDRYFQPPCNGVGCVRW